MRPRQKLKAIRRWKKRWDHWIPLTAMSDELEAILDD
jgi:hypothetical protein